MDDDFSLKRHWFYAQRPIAFGLTAEGGLLIEFDVEAAPGTMAHLGLHIPLEELKALRRGLELTETIRETLAAKPPAQGAH